MVVGAGIAGPTLGIGLRRLGCSVTLVEARESIEAAAGAFLGVAPNGMNAFDELGLGAPIASIGHRCDSFQFMGAADRLIGTIDRSEDEERFGFPLIMVRRGALHALLAETALERGVALRLGERVVGVEDEAGQPARVVLHTGERIEADLVFGCDGVLSTLRRLVFPDAPLPHGSGLLDFGGFCSAPVPSPPGTNVMVFGRRSFFGAFATGEGETWWFHNGPGADVSEPRSHLLSMHAEDPAWIRRVVEETPAVLGPWRLRRMTSLSRWSKGRVCLLGDAAHAMSPSAGQGVSMAVEDVVALVRELSDSRDAGQAFERFELARRARVESIARVAERNDGGKRGAGPVASWFRDRMMSLFLRHAGAAQEKSYAHRETLAPSRTDLDGGGALAFSRDLVAEDAAGDR